MTRSSPKYKICTVLRFLGIDDNIALNWDKKYCQYLLDTLCLVTKEEIRLKDDKGGFETMKLN